MIADLKERSGPKGSIYALEMLPNKTINSLSWTKIAQLLGEAINNKRRFSGSLQSTFTTEGAWAIIHAQPKP